MKTSDLRIGNWVMGNEPFQIDLDGLNRFDIHYKLNEVDRYEPIKLNEEWLERLGFEYTLAGWYDYGIFGVNIEENRAVESLGDFHNQFKLPKYVHELQNLYFALTGREL